MTCTTIEEIAHHEAGHAVGYIHLERDFIRVTVVPDIHKGAAANGHLKPRRATPRIRDMIWKWVVNGEGVITDPELRAHYGHTIITSYMGPKPSDPASAFR
jgi:hypothetical protein